MAALKKNNKQLKKILGDLDIAPESLMARGRFSLIYPCPTDEDFIIKASVDGVNDRFLDQLSGVHFPVRAEVLARETINLEPDFQTEIVVSRIMKYREVRSSGNASRQARYIIKAYVDARSAVIFDASLSDCKMHSEAIKGVISGRLPDSVNAALEQLADFAATTYASAPDFHMKNFAIDGKNNLIFLDPFQQC